MNQALAVFGFALLAVIAGGSFVMQATVNATLRSSLDSPYQAAFASYLGGTIVMALVLLATRQLWPAAGALQRSPWWAWTGGLWGTIYVVIIILLLRRLGAAPVLALFVLGQMIASLIFDDQALLGLTKHPIDGARVLGTVLVLAGAILVRR
jgi:bacterial/archaeal transporter family-2 protein